MPTHGEVVIETQNIVYCVILIELSLNIGTQQLDFLGNYQCRLSLLDNMHKKARAQVPIFNTTQMGYLSIVGTWTLLPFSGALYNINGVFWGIISHFQLLTTITFWGIVICTVSQPT